MGDQSRMPLVDAVRAARARGLSPMQIPGHKYAYSGPDRGAIGFAELWDLVRDDVPLQGGAEDNAFSEQFLEQAEALWSEAVGADYCKFLVNGGSQANLTALMAVVHDGEHIAVDRTSHRSAQAGLVLAGAMPEWVFPEIHPEFGLPIGLPTSALAQVSEQIFGLFVTSPAYVGTISELAPLAEWAHRRQIPLVVDQAWAAHLDFGVPGYPNALSQGADIVATSVHKALMGYSQTAVIATRGNLVAPLWIDRSLAQTATTSPSATLLATIDATRAAMVRSGTAAIERAISAAAQLKAALRRVPGVVVVDDANAGCLVDPLKVVLWLPRTGVEGSQLAAELWKLGIGVEATDRDTFTMTVTVVDTAEKLQAATLAIVGLIEQLRSEPRAAMPSAVWAIRPQVVLTPRQATMAERHGVPLGAAVGEICAEQFTPYPPGVPLIGPGELVTEQVVDAIRIAGKHGRVAYCSDPTLQTMQVVNQ